MTSAALLAVIPRPASGPNAQESGLVEQRLGSAGVDRVSRGRRSRVVHVARPGGEAAHRSLRSGLEEAREPFPDEVRRDVGDVADGGGELGLERDVIVPWRLVEARRAERVLQNGPNELLDPGPRVSGAETAVDGLRIGGLGPDSGSRRRDDRRRHHATPCHAVPPPTDVADGPDTAGGPVPRGVFGGGAARPRSGRTTILPLVRGAGQSGPG